MEHAFAECRGGTSPVCRMYRPGHHAFSWSLFANPFGPCIICSLQNYCPSRIICIPRVVHGLKIAATYFQVHVPKRFHSTQETYKSWMKNSIIYARNVEELFDRLHKVLTIFHKHNLIVSAKKRKFLQNQGEMVRQNYRREWILYGPEDCGSDKKHGFPSDSRRAFSILALLQMDIQLHSSFLPGVTTIR